MLIKTLIAGFGGQGVLSMGLNLAEAAMLEGKNVTCLLMELKCVVGRLTAPLPFRMKK